MSKEPGALQVPVDPPGQPLHRRLSRYFWGFPPFLALVETIALAVHFQDMDMVGEAVQQSPGQAFRAEYLRPLIERQVGGHQDRAPLVALAEDFTVDDGWGWIFTARAPSVSAGMSAARRPLRRPAADSMWACRAVWLDRGRRGSGAGLADGSRSPSICRTTSRNQIKFWGIQRVLAKPQTKASPSGSITR